jgi:ribonuclease D
MRIIESAQDLVALARELEGAPYITVDTEFMRDQTYWPKLCLMQVARPGGPAAIIDPLAEGMDLAPIYRLIGDTSVVKVLHAARQDIEIFWHQGDVIPDPLFDTQIAAMVCGFGDAASYETLVRRLTSRCGSQTGAGGRFRSGSSSMPSAMSRIFAMFTKNSITN